VSLVCVLIHMLMLFVKYRNQNSGLSILPEDTRGGWNCMKKFIIFADQYVHGNKQTGNPPRNSNPSWFNPSLVYGGIINWFMFLVDSNYPGSVSMLRLLEYLCISRI
jgi:hypothetical protein